MSDPTNAEILQAFHDHAANDEVFQDATRKALGEQAMFRAETEGTLASLATKEDIAELKQFMKEMKIGFGIIRFSWDNASKIGSFLLLIAGVFMFFKFGLAAIWAFFIGSKA